MCREYRINTPALRFRVAVKMFTYTIVSLISVAVPILIGTYTYRTIISQTDRDVYLLPNVLSIALAVVVLPLIPITVCLAPKAFGWCVRELRIMSGAKLVIDDSGLSFVGDDRVRLLVPWRSVTKFLRRRAVCHSLIAEDIKPIQLPGPVFGQAAFDDIGEEIGRRITAIGLEVVREKDGTVIYASLTQPKEDAADDKS